MDNTGGLRQLQDQLKRQYLLLERQQREKTKIKKQIQHTIQDYYSVLVQKKGLGKVITQDRLGNSYNFVKDLVLSISKDVDLGFEVLTLCQQNNVQQLSTLLLGMFYDNYSQNDPYLKKNVKFSQLLGKKISQMLLQQNFIKKQDSIVLSKQLLPSTLKLILKQFLKMQSYRQYFEMLANRVLNKIPHSIRFQNINMRRGSVSSPEMQKMQRSIIDLNHSQSITFQRSNSASMHEHQIQAKIQEAVQQYKTDIIAKAQMMPISLRVLCYSIVAQLQKQKKMKEQIINKFIWQLLEIQYFRPFQSNSNKKWNHFKNSHFNDSIQKLLDIMCRKIDSKFHHKLVQKIMNINKDKLIRKQNQSKKKIVINGGCISYRNLYYLFTVIKAHDEHLKKFNERVTNRVNKIHDMNPNFQFFKEFNNPSTSFLVFTQLIYGQIIQKDYQGMYLAIYNGNMIKNMLKQILSDTNFHILQYIQKGSTLQDILEKVIEQQQMQGEGNFSLGVLQHSQQFNMKIKYLLHLMRKQQINQQSMFRQMISQCLERQRSNVILFQKNKIQLLQCLTTVNKAKKLVKSQKDAQKNVDSHLKIVRILDTMQINLCITGPSTRPQKDKFTKTTNQSITIQNSQNCLHQQNIIQGLKHHATHVLQAVMIFCDLKQVKLAMETGKDTHKIYGALCQLIQYLKQHCRNHYNVNMEQYTFFQTSVNKVVMREIHQILIQEKQKTVAEIQFQKLLKDLSFIKPNKIKITGRDNLAQLEQVWQIACRYFKNINEKKNPTDKIQSILQMIQVIRISLQHDGLDKDQISDKRSIQIILAYCIIRSRPQKILANINFIQLFLSQDKLVVKEGRALERLKNAVALIKQKKLVQSLITQQQQFQQQLMRNETANKIQTMKQTQKSMSVISYI